MYRETLLGIEIDHLKIEHIIAFAVCESCGWTLPEEEALKHLPMRLDPRQRVVILVPEHQSKSPH
jgi:hypothetical protein